MGNPTNCEQTNHACPDRVAHSFNFHSRHYALTSDRLQRLRIARTHPQPTNPAGISIK